MSRPRTRSNFFPAAQSCVSVVFSLAENPSNARMLASAPPLITIGGGIALDPLPRRPRAREASRREYLQAVERNNKPEILAQLTQRSLFGLPQSEIPARTGWTDPEVHEK